MDHKQLRTALEDLRRTSEQLLPLTDRFDLDAVENAVSKRELAVARVTEAVETSAGAFSEEDLESVRESLRVGKSAFEKLLEIRRSGWTTATEMTKNDYVLRSISIFGTDASEQRKA